VRRSRPRFWEGDPVALETLRSCLVTVSRLLAPFTPFVADEIYDNLDGAEPSVHLTDWPVPAQRDEALEAAMAIARETVRLGLAARGAAKIKVRQPLHEVVVVAAGREREAIERLGEIVREELNVKQLRFVDEADELGSYTLKPNYRTLGPRFGKAMPRVAEAVAGLDPKHVALSLREGRAIGVFIDGHDHTLGPDDLLVALAPLQDYQLEREGSHAVALELSIDEDLRREGLAREIVHAVQLARREAGLDISDRIDLALDGDAMLLEAARHHETYLAGEVLAVSVAYDANGTGETASIEGRELRISVARAG
jgi:isoleucyl-tRNA synthetase